MFQKFIIVFFLLAVCLYPGQHANPQRTVTIDVVLDEESRELKTDAFLKALLDEVSAVFEKNFSVSFFIQNLEQWNSDNSIRTLESLFQNFCRQNPGKNSDIALGFTGQKNLSGQSGISLYQEARILVRLTDNRDFLLKVLIHELSHVFGAAHVNDPKSLMDRFLRGNRFDDQNRKIITLHRSRKFKTIRFPLPAEWLGYLSNLYQAIARANEQLKYTKLPEFRRGQLRKQLVSEAEIDSETLQLAFRRLEDVYIYQTFIFIELEQYDEALKACQKVLKINPELVEAYNLMGISSRRKGEIDDAIYFYQQVLKKDPCYPKVNYNLGIALAKKGETDRAISFYHRAIECNGRFAAPWNNLGYINLERGHIDSAIGYFQRAITINPHHPLAHSNLAEALLRKKRIPEAREKVKRALELDDSFPGPHNVLGNIYSELGDFEKAEKAYQTAISIQPAYFKAHFNLGNIYFKKRLFARAIHFFERSVGINPGFGNGYAGMGDCYLMLEKYQQAETEFKKALAAGYETAKLHLNFSYLRIRNQDFSGAIESASRAIKLDPGLEMAFKNLGIAHFKRGELSRARQAFDRVLEINPRNGSIHRNLAVVCFLQKAYQKAFVHMQRAEKLGVEVDRKIKRELEKIVGQAPEKND